jgi:hypothetical protein
VVDDVYGVNFNVDPPNGMVMDGHGHGTHVAGIIGAVGNNDLGVTGVNQVLNSQKTGQLNLECHGCHKWRWSLARHRCDGGETRYTMTPYESFYR